MKNKQKQKQKLYHASREKLMVGDIIVPNINSYAGVYCTASPIPHHTLFSFGERSIQHVKYYMYKVVPTHKHKIDFGGNWDEIIVYGAVEVVECLGEVSTKKKCYFISKNTKKERFTLVKDVKVLTVVFTDINSKETLTVKCFDYEKSDILENPKVKKWVQNREYDWVC